MDDGEPDSNDHSNAQVPGDPAGRQCGSRRLKCGYGPVGPQVSMGQVSPVFMELHVKCPIFLSKDYENAENY